MSTLAIAAGLYLLTFALVGATAWSRDHGPEWLHALHFALLLVAAECAALATIHGIESL